MEKRVEYAKLPVECEAIKVFSVYALLDASFDGNTTWKHANIAAAPSSSDTSTGGERPSTWAAGCGVKAAAVAVRCRGRRLCTCHGSQMAAGRISAPSAAA